MAAVLDANAQSAAQPRTSHSLERRGRWRLSHVGLGLALTAVLAGLLLPTENYLSPQSGSGYVLGIVGGSMMLLLLVYPLRKRKPSLAWLGSIRVWFRVHMLLGVLGPLCILYHSNFSLGATNSNVALACMLIVASSGLVGRFLYARIHHGLYGRRATASEFARDADNLKRQSGALRLLPGLMDAVEFGERRISAPAMTVVRPWLAAWRFQEQRQRMRRLVASAVAVAADRSPVIAAERERLTATATRYVEARLAAARRVAEFEACERLFAAWHLLHMPLFAMLVVVGIVHVVAVHLY